MDEKGIVTLVGLSIFLVLIMTMFYFGLPLLADSIGVAKSEVNDPIAEIFLDLLIPVVVMGIVVAYIIYSSHV